jgi:hypothetical protein
VLAADGTKLAASASNDATRSYEQIAQEVLAEAGRIDAEDEVHGEAHGDDLPEHLASRDGQRLGRPPNPHTPPAQPDGKINLTDPDCRNMKAFRGYVQRYNAQADTTEAQIVIAAEIAPDGLDFAQLDPMTTAAERELEAAGVTESPEVVLADAGYLG